MVVRAVGADPEALIPMKPPGSVPEQSSPTPSPSPQATGTPPPRGSAARWLHAWGRTLDRLGWVERGVGIALVLGIVVAITVQVVTRYAFDRPLVWVEESATYAFIWVVFIGASAALKAGRHVLIETFHRAMSPRGAAALRAFLWLLVCGLMLTLLVQGIKVMGVEARSSTVSLPIEIARMWFYSVPLSYSAASMLATAAYFLALETRASLGMDLPQPAGAVLAVVPRQ